MDKATSSVTESKGQVTTLEPRLARVEAELEAVTKDISALTGDVRALSSAIRAQGDSAELQMRQLHIAVTQAAGPRKTEWSTVVSAIALILAIGGAAFSPLFLRINDVQTGLSDVRAEHKQALRDLDLKLQNETKLAAQLVLEKTIAMQKEFDDVRMNGSPITQTRLKELETLMKLLLSEMRLVPKTPAS